MGSLAEIFMKSKLTKSHLDNLSKEQLIALCLVLSDTTSMKINLFDGYKTQLENINNYLNQESIVDELICEETAERAKFLITKADEIYAKLISLENSIVPDILDDKAFVQESRKGGIDKYFKD